MATFLVMTPQAQASPIAPGSFSVTVKTDNPGNSASNQFTFYTLSSPYNYDVYWEEIGNESNNGTSSATSTLFLTFPSPGTYRIDVTGDFPSLYLSGEAPKLLSIEQWGDIQWKTMERALYGAVNARINATDAPDLSQVTSMDSMFCNATSMNDSINHWDVSHITDMSALFAGATAFNQPLNNWDVSNVTSFNNGYCSNGAFEDATTFNQSLGDWDLNANVNLQNMFDNSGITINNYSTTLIGWASLPLVPNAVNLGTVPAQYSLAAKSARATLTNTYNWTITDNGLSVSLTDDTFITTWDTRLDAGSPNELQIYATGGSAYYFNIDWGTVLLIVTHPILEITSHIRIVRLVSKP